MEMLSGTRLLERTGETSSGVEENDRGATETLVRRIEIDISPLPREISRVSRLASP